MQGPLDVEAIRDIDAGKMTANQAFTSGGILGKMKRATLEECNQEERKLALESLALFAAMEINALMVLSRDLGVPDPDLFLAGSPAPMIKGRVAELMGRDVETLGRCSAANGCACIAKDVFEGCKNILGLEVDERVKSLRPME
jgi:hypothetical protein